MMRLVLPVVISLLSPALSSAQALPSGTKNQNVTTNNGTMFQFNITVNPETQKSLKQNAKAQSGHEDGWLNLLTPANDPDIATSCRIPQNEVKIVLGGGAVGACTDDHPSCGIIADSKRDSDNVDIVSIQRIGSAFYLHALIFDEEGKVLTKIENNRPHVNLKRAFEWSRPDAHTLIVRDDRNREVLHVRFVNKRTFYMTGVLYDSRGNQAKIDKDGIHLFHAHQAEESGVFAGNCSTNAGRSALSF